MYRISFYVPESYKETVKSALFAAGAGRIGDYDSCSWECEGTGQFRPLSGSRSFIGKKDFLEHVREYRVEMVCRDDKLTGAVKALIEAHPYEEPAYGIEKVLTLEDLSGGDVR